MIKVVRATEGDKAVLVDSLRAFHTAQLWGEYVPFDEVSAALMVDAVLHAGIAQIAVEDEEPVGAAMALFHGAPMNRAYTAASVIALYVQSKRASVEKQLMSKIEQVAEQQGAVLLFPSVTTAKVL